MLVRQTTVDTNTWTYKSSNKYLPHTRHERRPEPDAKSDSCRRCWRRRQRGWEQYYWWRRLSHTRDKKSYFVSQQTTSATLPPVQIRGKRGEAYESDLLELNAGSSCLAISTVSLVHVGAVPTNKCPYRLGCPRRQRRLCRRGH